MIPLSRTARFSDSVDLGVSDTILKYATSPKRMSKNPTFRYKFWDYSIALKLIEENKHIKEVLDVALDKEDCPWSSLLSLIDVNLVTVDYNELSKLSVRDHKYPLVTCFGLIEHVELKRAFFLKLLKHVAIDGIVVITTDNETISKYKKRVISHQDLIDLSIIAENIGYELYDLDKDNSIDYLEDKKGELMSLVLKRVGR